MTQTILDKDTVVKIETPITRLYNIRLQYYNALIIELKMLNSKKKEIINNYKQEVQNIDNQITQLKQQERGKRK